MARILVILSAADTLMLKDGNTTATGFQATQKMRSLDKNTCAVPCD